MYLFNKSQNVESSLFFILILTLSLKIALGKSRYGLVKITAANYESTIIDGGKEAWIVAIKGAGKVSIDQWTEFEFLMRGMMVRVGIVDPQKDGAFLKRKGFLQESNSYPVARVYPYGGWKVKAAGMVDAKSMADAKKNALRSLPDETTKLVTMKDLEHFVHSSYRSSPPRFPVLLFTDKRVTAALYKALSIKYSTYFNFGVMREPTPEFKHKFNIKDLPAILVMLATVLPNNRLTFSSIPYELKAYGPVSYLTVAKFLYSVHETHWTSLSQVKKFKGVIKLKEDYMEDVESILAVDTEEHEEHEEQDDTLKEAPKESAVVEITYKNYKDVCGDKAVGVCLIAFLDGQDKKSVKQSLRVLKDVQKMECMEDKPLHYLWVNATCHPEYGVLFGIFADTLPSLLLAKPRQRLFTTLTLKDFNAETVSDQVMRVVLGRDELMRYSRFTDMMPVDCYQREQSRKPSGKKNCDEL